ncbi:uncharacterized protein LOC127831493 [Dreissena polymorpha]|uniref:uncharacterized protein LOC127831493 n=1 Tax=Dreissena polymorpha TaxID=45954 RepID=UPI0022651C46|nr:uncharacterized protein LOC127831493 [Dreissena polymorpha]
MTPSNKLYALEYLVYANNPGGFDFEGSSGAVNVEITCGDSVSNVRETLIVNIINTAPVITNPGGSSDVADDVSGTLTLKTLDFVTFDKSDATCSMTSADGGPFAVTGSRDNEFADGVNSERVADCEKATHDVDVNGGLGSPITKLSLVDKDLSTTDTVFTATGSDVENDNVIYSMLSCTPNATCPFMSPMVATDKYNKNPTPYTVIVEITAGEIRAKSVINFEKVNKHSYEIEIHAYDGYSNSTTETFTLLIVDVNEKPSYSGGVRSYSGGIRSYSDGVMSYRYSGGVRSYSGGPGEQISCPDFKNDIENEDVGDVHTYKMSCPRGSGVFVMDPLTACVTMTKEWNLDAANKRLGEETVVCTVTATDRRGLTSTATFNIKIKEEDDNKLFLSQTSYVYCATVGSTSESGPFYASGTGDLIYGDLSSYSKGTKFETTLRVTDSAGHYDEYSVTIFICDQPPPAPSNPNSASGASSASATSGGIDNFMFWLIPALLLLALMAELAVYLIRRCIEGIK